MTVAGSSLAVGRGKVILLGEHAVVYGHAALAGALGRGVHARARAAADPTPRLVVDAWGVDTDRDPDGGPARALRAILDAMELTTPFEVEAHADVPPRAGLGSSAALAVAVVRALAAVTGRELAPSEVETLAASAEGVFHGNPSGVDVALAARGGLGTFRRGAGLTPVTRAPFSLVIGLSGEARDTAARVAQVATQRDAAQEEVDAKLARLGALALEGAALLAGGGPVAGLGPLMLRAQDILASLGLSSPTIERMCDLAARVGATGAKLTGAGGGGAVIAVGADEAVLRAWRGAGLEAFIAEVGVPA